MNNPSKRNAFVEKIKEFKPTSWMIDNPTAAYFMTILVTLFGLIIFLNLPKEQFPDIVVPQLYVATVYAGNSPQDIENLVTRPIEKEIKSITGAKIKKITSNSIQDFSGISVEFESDVKVDLAKQKIKDAVDKARPNLPTDLTVQPNVIEFSFSDLPIMYITVSGDYDALKLKSYAKKLKDKFEELPQISKAEIIGAPEREIQILVDKNRLEATKTSFADIEAAVARENLNIFIGDLQVGNLKRNVRIKGQLTSAYQIRDIVIKNIYGSPIYLRDIADIQDGVKDRESASRLNRKNTLTINIVKRAGENLIATADKIKTIVAEFSKNDAPSNLKVGVIGDQSKATKTSFNDLVNSIILGFLFVFILLLFFMGVNNAFFVALSVPLSIFIAFTCLPIGNALVGTSITLNFIVLFALLFGLGIIVDDAIVVIENTHRIFNNGKTSIVHAAKAAAGEVFVPVLAGTLTTLAPFFPLLFWKGVIGKFMIYLPTILILTLAASLVVAFLINPIFAVSFMKPEGKYDAAYKRQLFKSKLFWLGIAVSVIFHFSGSHAIGNFILFVLVFYVIERFFLNNFIIDFQKKHIVNLMNKYEQLLRYILQKRRPVWLFASLFVLFIFSCVLITVRMPASKIVFFPEGDPNNIFVYIKLPVGTNIDYTEKITKTVEEKVFELIGDNNPIVESVISNIAIGASNPSSNDQSAQPNKARIQISFVEFEKREGLSTRPILDSLRLRLNNVAAGAIVTVEQEKGGPPTGAPVNIEVIGEDFGEIITTANQLKNFIQSKGIKGIEELRLDVEITNPEITFHIDREKTNRLGLSTAQVGLALRTALFGKEISKLKDNEEEYKIQLKYKTGQRQNVLDLLNSRITYRDFTNGEILQIPISALVKIDYTNSIGGIRRKNLKRVITLVSNVLTGYSAQAVNIDIAKILPEFANKPQNILIKQTGETEEQAETNVFLGNAMLISLMLILLILVLLFNSFSKSLIVLTEIFFSVIGVLLGFGLTTMTMPTIMVGIGIIGLAGIVIKNAVLLIEFADELKTKGYRTKEAIIQSGKIRIIPVLLTALATILGLIPLAVGLNINFETLLTHLNPHIFFGGDSVVFWGPLSWTIIFGLSFAFFMTLFLVPSMYIIAEVLRRPMSKFYGTKWIALLGLTGPFFFILTLIMYVVRKLQGRPFIPKYLGRK